MGTVIDIPPQRMKKTKSPAFITDYFIGYSDVITHMIGYFL